MMQRSKICTFLQVKSRWFSQDDTKLENDTSLTTPGRVLVGEGVLTKICRKKPKPRKFFLFNDALVYGNIIINEKKYNKQHILPLEEVKILGLEDEDGLRNGWQIISPGKSFAVYAATGTEKAEWMAHINKCIDDLHHCRRCGLVVCGNCSSRKFLLPDISMKPIRVCDTCYEKLSSGAAKPTDKLTPEEKAATMAMQKEQGKLASLSRKESETMAESGSSGDERSDDEEERNSVGTVPTFYETVKRTEEPMEE
eukprot:Seg1498.7 transcript_id=Seg1498.7/GoldUCD/mRNA.D3Y31 product="Pleckstrin-like domain-containing family F member 2" protein_id=Seg1498.7/GoldUCD/D3Y31